MATGAAADGFFRGIFEGSLAGSDTGIQRRPYHRNCGCALHKLQNHCSHAPRCCNVSYPMRRTWSEGCLSLVASSSSSESPGHASPCPSSPALGGAADVGKAQVQFTLFNEELLTRFD